MKPENILHSLNDLDEDLILDAAEPVQRPRLHGRRLCALVTAAVLASTLIGTCFAYAIPGSWFHRFFAANSGGSLDQEKSDYISQSTAQFQQSHSKDGFTISLESALSDGVNTIIQFRVDVPEGTALDARSYGITNWEDFELTGDNGESLRDSGGWTSYDEDPEDHMFTLLYASCNDWYEKNIDRIFGTTWKLQIEGIQGHYIEDTLFRNEILVTGPWEFEVTIPENGNRELQFISEPVSCPAKIHTGVEPTQNENVVHILTDPGAVQLTSLRLRALTLVIDYQLPSGETRNAEFESFRIVMHDGSQVLVGIGQADLLGTAGYGAPGRSSFNFSTPIVLDQVDHILLPDGTKLYPVG